MLLAGLLAADVHKVFKKAVETLLRMKRLYHLITRGNLEYSWSNLRRHSQILPPVSKTESSPQTVSSDTQMPIDQEARYAPWMHTKTSENTENLYITSSVRIVIVCLLIKISCGKDGQTKRTSEGWTESWRQWSRLRK